MSDDLEERINQAIERAIGRVLKFVQLHAWNFADHVFKAAAWLLAIGVIQAAHTRDPKTELRVVVIVLTLIWMVAVAAEGWGLLLRTVDAITGRVVTRIQPKHELARILLQGLAAGLIAIPFIVFVFSVLVPFIGSVMAALLAVTPRP